MKVIKNDDMRIPVKMWLEDIEDNALEQAINLSKLPFSFMHIAIMPDSVYSDEGQGYLAAMNYALDFAKENRFRMIETIKNIFSKNILGINYDETINIHHNYAILENHFNHNVIVHRLVIWKIY